jgi:predicted metal-dependent hydrolase
VRDFVQRFTPWIDRKVEAMRSYAQPSEPVPGMVEFALTDEKFAVEWRSGARRGLEESPGRILVQAPDERGARGLLQVWLKRAAYERLAPRLLQLANELNYSVARVSIRCQRTRWGSCSTRGTVSLNCSLLFLNFEVVRYLFVHELAHTKHMNHSAHFWRLVEKIEPDYRRLDRDLLAGWRTVPGWVFKT